MRTVVQEDGREHLYLLAACFKQQMDEREESHMSKKVHPSYRLINLE